MDENFRDRYAFFGEWYDNQASLVRRFTVFYYPTDDSLELFDLKNRRTFVRRMKVNGISIENFYIGATLHVFGRLLKIVDYACEDTRNKLQDDMEMTLVLLKPLPMSVVGKILTIFHKNKLRVTRIKKTSVNHDHISFLYRDLLTDARFPFLLEYLSGNHVHIVELVGKDAVAKLMKISGHKDPLKAEPGTIRAMYGTDIIRNCMTVSSSVKEAKENIAYFFPPPPQHPISSTATLSNCTLCIIKPHAVREGRVGDVLESVDAAGFNVTALNMLTVENVNAAEFYEVYKGIVPEYMGMVEELASGPCVALEIVSKDPNVNTAVEFRKLAGPADPEIGRLLRPHTLRAKFGKTKVHNAIHCSDLPEDGLLEVEYFFKILDY